MTNKEFIKQHKIVKKKDTNIIVRILRALEDLCGLAATVCWVILLTVIAILTLGGNFGNKKVVDKYGNRIYK